MKQRLALTILLGLGLSTARDLGAKEIVQEDTKIAFPDVITIEHGDKEYALRATGVGLREATFMKFNVYAMASYMEEGIELGDDPAGAIIETECAKRIEMRFVRNVGPDKITGAYRDGIKKNFKDETGDFAEDLVVFLSNFDIEIEEGGSIVLTYLPGVGVGTSISGTDQGFIENAALGRALWTIWFGEKPVSKGMRKDLLSLVTPED